MVIRVLGIPSTILPRRPEHSIVRIDGDHAELPLDDDANVSANVHDGIALIRLGGRWVMI